MLVFFPFRVRVGETDLVFSIICARTLCGHPRYNTCTTLPSLRQVFKTAKGRKTTENASERGCVHAEGCDSQANLQSCADVSWRVRGVSEPFPLKEISAYSARQDGVRVDGRHSATVCVTEGGSRKCIEANPIICGSDSKSAIVPYSSINSIALLGFSRHG